MGILSKSSQINVKDSKVNGKWFAQVTGADILMILYKFYLIICRLLDFFRNFARAKEETKDESGKVKGESERPLLTNKNMNIIEVTSLEQAGVDVFSTLTEAQLRNRLEPEKGVFIVESPKVIRVALDAGYTPTALLCERKHIGGDAKDIVERCKDIQVYTGERELLAQLTGYTLTRGVLCAMRRPAERTVSEICEGARRLVVIDGGVDTTNIGAIFRSAAALGIDGVLLTRNSCDPLNRRAVRVSMGSVFLVPWTWLDDDISSLHAQGFRTAAMALTDDSIKLDDERLKREPRLAIVMGTEGDGLPLETIHAADYVVRIPMAHGVDSLNVGAAASVAFWELRSG